MLSPADDILISMARRARVSGCDDAVDAIELAAGTPLAVESIDRMLTRLAEAGLVSYRSRLPSFNASPPFRSFGLTEEGWARVRELESLRTTEREASLAQTTDRRILRAQGSAAET
jgi:DNA-binding PadR family transcriptional regulator